MTTTTTELARADLGFGLTLVKVLSEGKYHWNDQPWSSEHYQLLGLDEDTAIGDLAILAQVLKNLPVDGALDLDEQSLEELLKDHARDLSEDAEVPFTYTSAYGETSTYTPASLWESSGCEWEESAQEGYDYGWNI